MAASSPGVAVDPNVPGSKARLVTSPARRCVRTCCWQLAFGGAVRPGKTLRRLY
jgi:hypothetical protein